MPRRDANERDRQTPRPPGDAAGRQGDLTRSGADFAAAMRATSSERGRLHEEYRRLLAREREARAEAEAARRQLDQLVNGIGCVVWEADPKTLRFTFVNDRLSEILGYTRAYWMRKTCVAASFLHPEDRPRVLGKFAAAIRDGGDHRLEYRIFAADGRTVWVHNFVQTLPGEDGNVQQLRGLMVDVTDRKKTEQRLVAQYELSRVLAEAESADEGAPRILEIVGRALDRELGTIWLREGEALRCKCTWHAPSVHAGDFEERSRGMILRSGEGLPGRVLESGAPAFVEDVREEGGFVRTRAAARFGPRAALAFPLRAGGETIGVAEFFSTRLRPQDDDLLRDAGNFGDRIGHFFSRRQVEEELQKFKHISDNAADSYFFIAPDGRVLYVNKVACERLGYSEEELLELSVPEIDFTLQERKYREIFEQVQREVVPPFESVHLRRDGTSFPVEISANGLAIGGRPYVFAAVRDITERKEAEEAKGHLATLVESTNDAIVGLDTKHTIVSWNSGGRAMFGYAVEEVVGKTLYELIVPERLPTTRRRLERDGALRNHETQILKKDGARVDVSLSVSRFRDEPGKTTGFVAVMRDVTERKRVEEAVRESRERFRAIFAQATVGIVECDLSGRILLANDRYCEIVGYGHEELLGKRWQEITHPDDLQSNAELFEEAVTRGGEFEIEKRYVRKEGSTVWVKSSASVMRDRSGKMTYALAVVEDITARRLAQEIQEQAFAATGAARAEAEAANERLAFLAEASREMGRSLDYEAALSRVAHLAVPRVADWCLVDLIEKDDSVRRLAAVHTEPTKRKLAREMERLDPAATEGIAGVLATGQSRLIPEVTDEVLKATVHDAKSLEILGSLEPGSWVSVPLVVRGETVGAISFASERTSGRRYGTDDLELAEELARRAAQAVENARLYQQHHHTATTLQKSFLPPDLPEIPGIEAAARFRAAGEGNEVGGDFYDLFDTSGGWAVVMGDVCGKGPEAAALTALARYTVRTAAMRERRPSHILKTLNSAVLRQSSDGRFCTIAYGLLRPAKDGFRLDVANGGHPLPLLLRADGRVETLGEHGTLLGVFPDPTLTNRSVGLGPGDTLVFYTDGIVEARGAEEIFGEGRLMELAAGCDGLDAGGIAERMEREIIEFSGGTLRDDAAVLVLRVA